MGQFSTTYDHVDNEKVALTAIETETATATATDEVLMQILAVQRARCSRRVAAAVPLTSSRTIRRE